MDTKKISEIKGELKAAAVEGLPSFIRQYGKDTRSGVVQLVSQAQKCLDKLEAEKERTMRLKAYETEYAPFGAVCGVDEVGRGPLAGPVVAGAVILPYMVAVGIGMVSPQRIDEINILQATYEAMRQAIHNLGVVPDILLNDAVTIPGVAIRQVPIVKGDAKSISIGAASIVAKVTRDRLMVEYDAILPGYGFADNKGYGSAAHIEAIKQLGATPIHRRSFIGKFV